MTPRRLGALLIVALCALADPVHAHTLRPSAVALDLGEHQIGAELVLPVDQLALALETDAAALVASVPARRVELIAYVAAHVHARTPDGRAFSLHVDRLDVRRDVDGDSVVAHLELRAPEGASTERFVFGDDVILHRVVTHKIFVSVRQDFKRALLGDKPELAGLLRYQRDALEIDRSQGSWWRGFRSVFELGTRHIAEGTDHQLFLLALLLPVPLLVTRRRWRGTRTIGASARAAAKIVTAFTVGHSLTLVVGALGLVAVPGQAVEILIAVSILVSALHALRPIFPGRELLVAGVFGLVHGLAFSTVLAGFGFDAGARALGILAFNLGIEALQLGLVLLSLPWLVLLARSSERTYTAIRVIGASFAAVASVGWVLERAFGVATLVTDLVETIAAHALWPLAAIALLALAARRIGTPERVSTAKLAVCPADAADGFVRQP